MATVNMTIADALDAKIKDPASPWGGDVVAWKAWLKAKTREELLAQKLRQIEADSQASLAAARAAAIGADAALA